MSIPTIQEYHFTVGLCLCVIFTSYCSPNTSTDVRGKLSESNDSFLNFQSAFVPSIFLLGMVFIVSYEMLDWFLLLYFFRHFYISFLLYHTENGTFPT